ncbi:zf-HC2 domain-containing protein [Saccharopolyspora phatthalungensis]|uniref:Anti-sigma factor RsiW n=1 Tax=Saccharopolyspora phatthalungensis TaxID=664693 RepID=A0A840QEP0_9PSEU|nr:zf-HC2 domain-containing protein [Saccharopolyspora phatthalungensis]MBB5155503.1 anti-sigma factor RsiW [Saccharopolyspora phatthalungensis]
MQHIDHAGFQAKLNAYSAGMLSDVEWLMVRTHLAECTSCRAELSRPETWNRAAPQWISPSEAGPSRTLCARRQCSRPGWAVVFGLAMVAALVAFAVGYALGTAA